MRSSRLGVSIRDGLVRGVLAEGRTVVWQGEQQAENAEFGLALARLFAACPRTRAGRTSVAFALGPSLARCKSIDGLGTDADAASLTAAVGANLDRFFLKPSARSLVAPVGRSGGAWWVWIVDADIVHQISLACRSEGYRFAGMVPSALAVAPLLGDGTHRLDDAGQGVIVEVRSGATTTLSPQRHESASSTAEAGAAPVPALADAHAVAIAAPTGTGLWDPAAGHRARRRRVLLRATLAAVASLSLVVTGFTSDLRVLHAAWMLDAPSLVESAAADSAESLLREHLRASAGIDSLTAFSGSRRSVLSFVADLSARLPKGSAILSLRVDPRGASVVALAAPGESFLPALGEIEGVTTVQLVGAVTRERIQGREVQRIAAVLPFAARKPGGAPESHPRTAP